MDEMRARGRTVPTGIFFLRLLRFDESGRHGPPALRFFLERYAESYYLEMKAFLNSVRKNLPVPVTTKDALMATRIALAAQKSVAEDRPVELKEIN